MIVTHKLEMDLVRRQQSDVLWTVQGDHNTRVLELTLLENGEAWTVPEGAGVWMRYCKPDGTKGIYDTLPDGSCAWSIGENSVSVTLAPQMLTAAGVVFAQVELVQEALTLATFTVQINVERDPAAGVLASEDYVNMLQWMEAELALRLAEAAESGAFTGPQGVPGTSAYDYAVEAGYTGTEEAFAQQMMVPCLPLAGGTMAGAVEMDGNAITGLAAPAANTDAANKAYVDQRRKLLSMTLPASGWSSGPPYTMRIGTSEVALGNWVRVEPTYAGEFSADLAIKAAFASVDYAYAVSKGVAFICLESKPEMDLPVTVEVLR